MGRLTTHVLDTAAGRPAAGLRVRLWHLPGDAEPVLIGECNTDADGRTPAPLLQADAFRPGRYQLEFGVGDYFRATGTALPDPAFLDEVVVRFGIAGDRHYHVPLLVSPYGYSTYRGS